MMDGPASRAHTAWVDAMTFSTSRRGRALVVFGLALALSAGLAEARPGGGGSAGSRGSRTFDAPAPTTTAPAPATTTTTGPPATTTTAAAPPPTTTP